MSIVQDQSVRVAELCATLLLAFLFIYLYFFYVRIIFIYQIKVRTWLKTGLDSEYLKTFTCQITFNTSLHL